MLEKHIIPTIGQIDLVELREAHIAAMRDAWTTGEGSTSRRPLARSTVQKHLKILRQALGVAVGRSQLPRNPALSVRLPVRAHIAEQRALDEREIPKLLRVSRGTAHDVPIRVALATGIRQAELLDLRWDDVDFVASKLFVRGTKSMRSRRWLELSEATLRLLSEHRERAAFELAERVASGSALIFPGSDGARWNRGLFYRDYRQLVAKSGIEAPESVKWHTLRRTAASQWLLRGVDILVVSRRLGHASVSFTMDVYAHLLPGQQRTAAEALDYLLCS